MRALRNNPDLAGTVVLNITIQPSGAVSDCEIISSELGDSELERKIVSRVKLLNFGSKDVPVYTIKYPLTFYPSRS